MNCYFCKFNEFNEIFTTFNFPIYMGVNNDKSEYNDFSIGYCKNCKCIQTLSKIDLAKLYNKNHNIDLVGDIWKDHFKSFKEFLLLSDLSGDILEIGDPSAKLALLCTNDINSWDIVEPNPNNIKHEKINFIKSFFENYNTNKKYDFIVHSHLIEHQYNPIDFILKCKALLSDSGKMCMSFPNMNYYLYNFNNPILCLNFEHTYYLEFDIIQYILNFCGFKIDNCINYKNHSIFISCSKNNCKNDDLNIIKENNDLIIEQISNNYNSIINYINHLNSMNYKEIGLYGCHVTSQFLLFNGLKNVSFILDGAPSKINHTLYGTDIKVHSPEYILSKKDIPIIVNHCGIYKEEIMKKLKEINNGVILL